MTRKDYIAAAELLRRVAKTHNDPLCERVCLSVATGLADIFAQDNRRFDRTRFLLACGVSDQDVR